MDVTRSPSTYGKQVAQDGSLPVALSAQGNTEHKGSGLDIGSESAFGGQVAEQGLREVVLGSEVPPPIPERPVKPDQIGADNQDSPPPLPTRSNKPANSSSPAPPLPERNHGRTKSSHVADKIVFPDWLATSPSGSVSELQLPISVEDVGPVHELPLDESAVFFAKVQGQTVVIKPLDMSHTFVDNVATRLMQRPGIKERVRPYDALMLAKTRSGTHPQGDDVMTSALEGREVDGDRVAGPATYQTEQHRFVGNQSYQVQDFLTGKRLSDLSESERKDVFSDPENLMALGALVATGILLNDHDHLPHFCEGHTRSAGNDSNLLVQDGKLRLIDMGSFATPENISSVMDGFKEQIVEFGRGFSSDINHSYFARLEAFIGTPLNPEQRAFIQQGFKQTAKELAAIDDQDIEQVVNGVRADMGAPVDLNGIPDSDDGDKPATARATKMVEAHVAGLKYTRDSIKQFLTPSEA